MESNERNEKRLLAISIYFVYIFIFFFVPISFNKNKVWRFALETKHVRKLFSYIIVSVQMSNLYK